MRMIRILALAALAALASFTMARPIKVPEQKTDYYQEVGKCILSFDTKTKILHTKNGVFHSVNSELGFCYRYLLRPRKRIWQNRSTRSRSWFFEVDFRMDSTYYRLRR
jgi:hypothetical protein